MFDKGWEIATWLLNLFVEMRGKKNSRGVIAEAETEVTRIFNSLERNLEYRLKYVERKSYEEFIFKNEDKRKQQSKKYIGNL